MQVYGLEPQLVLMRPLLLGFDGLGMTKPGAPLIDQGVRLNGKPVTELDLPSSTSPPSALRAR